MKRRQQQPSTAADARLIAGTQTLIDLIAPGVVEVGRDHVRVDSQYVRTLYIRAYPSSVYPGWLGPLIDFDEPVELSLHLTPVDSAATIGWLDRQIARFTSSRNVASRQGYIADSEREVAYEQHLALRDALQRGHEKMYQVGAYLLLRAASPAALDAATARVQGILAGMQLSARLAHWEQDKGLRSVAPLATDELGDVVNLNTRATAGLFPLSSASVAMDDGWFYGTDGTTQGPVYLDPFDPSMLNANHLLLGVAGGGKSFAAKLLAIRGLLHGAEVWAIDPQDEYGPLVRAVAGQTVRLGGGSGQRLNVFDLPPRGRELDEADPLAAQVAALVEFVATLLTAPGERLPSADRDTLDRALFATYAAAGITRDPETHGRRPPVLGDLYAALQELHSPLAERLARYVHGSLAGVVNGDTTVDLTRRLVVFDLSRLEDELRPKVIHLVGTYVWNQVRARKRRRLFLVDEAWTLLQYPEGARFLSGLVRQARKHYLGVLTISQEIRELFDSSEGQTIVSNSATKLLFRQDPSNVPLLEQRLGLSPIEAHAIVNAGPGEALLFSRNSHIALRVLHSHLEYDLATTRPAERLALDAVAR
jgi:conjugal transfer ATP-binding protein TraC